MDRGWCIAAKIDVEVEPRDSHTKSHAGIFTRFQNKNIKRGQTLTVDTLAEGVSADTILLEVRMDLVDISSIEECHLALPFLRDDGVQFIFDAVYLLALPSTQCQQAVIER